MFDTLYIGVDVLKMPILSVCAHFRDSCQMNKLFVGDDLAFDHRLVRFLGYFCRDICCVDTWRGTTVCAFVVECVCVCVCVCMNSAKPMCVKITSSLGIYTYI